MLSLTLLLKLTLVAASALLSSLVARRFGHGICGTLAGMPMIAGPGSIATIMLLTSRAQGTEQTLVVLTAMAAVLVLTLGALVAAGPLMKLLGTRVEAVITRLLGVLLAALAAQYVIDGLKAVFL